MSTAGPLNKPVGLLSPGDELRLKRKMEAEAVAFGKLVEGLREGIVAPGPDLQRLHQMITAGGEPREHAEIEIVLRRALSLMQRTAMAPIRAIR